MEILSISSNQIGFCHQKVQFTVVTYGYNPEIINLLWDVDFSRVVIQSNYGFDLIRAYGQQSANITLYDILRAMGFSPQSILNAGMTFYPYVSTCSWDNYIDTPIKESHPVHFTIKW